MQYFEEKIYYFADYIIYDVGSIYVQWGKKIFDPLLILYVCPLTKK